MLGTVLLSAYGQNKARHAMSATLNIYPNSLINIRKFESLLLLAENDLDSLTFLPVHRKFGLSEDKISDSRLLDNQIDKHMKYCPECLCGTPIHKLIWQVKEISFCETHKIKLMSICWNCGKNIPMLKSNFTFGQCPNCNSNLKDAPRIDATINNKDLWCFNNWQYLLDPDANKLELVQNLTIGQRIALKLLFIIKSSELNLKYQDITAREPIFNLARNNKINQSLISLDSIIKILKKLDISVADFFAIEVPDNFIKDITVSKEISPTEEFSCLAPWCKGYKRPGTLKSALKFKKKDTQRDTYNYNLYCGKCGVKYSLDKKSSKLNERGYFIDFAWGRVKPNLQSCITLKQLIKDLNSSNDMVLRSIIYLAANNLLVNVTLPIELPSSHNEKTVNEIRELIINGISYKEIMKRLNLPYRVFLYYLYVPALFVEFQNRKVLNTNQIAEHERNKEAFNNAIEHFQLNNIPITINSICKYLNICHETLRYRGFLQDIKLKKEMQKQR